MRSMGPQDDVDAAAAAPALTASGRAARSGGVPGGAVSSGVSFRLAAWFWIMSSIFSRLSTVPLKILVANSRVLAFDFCSSSNVPMIWSGWLPPMSC